MNGKFVVAIFAVLCASQCFAKSVEPETYGIVEDIAQLAEKVSKNVAQIIKTITELAEDLNRKIAELIKKLDIQGKFNKFVKDLQELAQHISGDAQTIAKCLAEQKSAANALETETLKKIDECSKNALGKIPEINQHIHNIIANIFGLIDKLRKDADTCFWTHIGHLQEQIECQKKSLAECSEKVEKDFVQARQEIDSIKSKLQEIYTITENCVNDINTNTNTQLNLILESFKSCVENSQ